MTVRVNDEVTRAGARSPWRKGQMVGGDRPTMTAYVRTGYFNRRMTNVPPEETFAWVPGVVGNKVWMAHWTVVSDYRELPKIKSVQLDQDFDQNGVAQVQIIMDNIAYPEQTGLHGVFHAIERGHYAPFTGYDPPTRPAVGDRNEWFDILHDKSTQITIVAGYGDNQMPIFTGFITDVDLVSRPDQITVTARDFGQMLTDQPCYLRAKVPHVKDPITFSDRRDAEHTEDKGYGARASGSDHRFPPRRVLDTNDNTYWMSDRQNQHGDKTWIEIDLPAGRYDSLRIEPKFKGMSIYLALHVSSKNAPGGKPVRKFDQPLNEGWVHEGRGDIPGTTIPYIKKVETLKAKRQTIAFPEWGYIVGDNTKLRIYFTSLQYGFHGNRQRNYRAACVYLKGIRRKVKKEAKREKWILVDDLADVVRTVFQWCGFQDWEVETTGVRLSKRSVWNRGNKLIEIVQKACEAVGYVFFVKPPDSFDDEDLDSDVNLSTGVAVFRQAGALKKHHRPNEPQELIHEDQTLTGVDAKLSDEPLAHNIRVRGHMIRGKKKRRKRRGRVDGGDHTYRYTFVYRPPWADPNISRVRNANIKKYLVHYDNHLRSRDECKVAAMLIAFQGALASAQAQVNLPALPWLGLDQRHALYDTGTGLSTRLYVATRSLEFTSGEDGHFTAALGGSLMDFPDIVAVRKDLHRALRNIRRDPGPSDADRQNEPEVRTGD